MDLYGKADFERLSRIREENCISIYIPTHLEGEAVNEGMDRVAFKNKVQVIEKELERKNVRNISGLLKNAIELIEDTSFWKDQLTGLAVFINSSIFNVYKLPIRVKDFSLIAPMFELTPLLPMLVEYDTFYTISISQHKIRLFKNTSFLYEELDISKYVPSNIDEVFATYNFNKESQIKQTNFGRLKRPTPNKGSNATEAIHGSNPKDKEYKYLIEFLEKVDDGIFEVIKETDAPIVIAAVDYVGATYLEISKLKHLEPEFIRGNPDELTDRQLHYEALSIASNRLNKGRRKDLEKYPVWAGTGKTSYDLQTILNAAFDGRVESVFIEEGVHIWGKYHEQNRQADIHNQRQEGDICLINLIAEKTIENNGKAYLVSKEEMPEKAINTDIASTFRY